LPEKSQADSCELALPRLALDRWLQVAETAREEATPVIIDGVFSKSPAVATWSPAHFAILWVLESIRLDNGVGVPVHP
jgi:hypothetical protein